MKNTHGGVLILVKLQALAVVEAGGVNTSGNDGTLLIFCLLDTLSVTNCISLKNWDVGRPLLPALDLAASS